MIASKSFLVSVIVVQWLSLTFILYRHQDATLHDDASCPRSFAPPMTTELPSHQIAGSGPPPYASGQDSFEWQGVAATLALKAPKWFHRRYTSMLYNVLDNLPDKWALQVFVQPEWWKKEILHLHRGLPKLLSHPRVIVTELPQGLWKLKPKQIFTQAWFWESMIANHTFLFSGNGVMCSHSIVSIDTFRRLDFCGTPHAKDDGGDTGTHSVRNRKAMLEAIEYGKPDMNIGSEGHFFAQTLAEMNRESPGRFKIATRNETILFGGASSLITDSDKQLLEDFEQYGPSLVMPGIGSNMAWDIRDRLLQICPEWKLIFPSLHEPNCFGASPNSEKCAASICALQPDRPKTGC